MADAAEAKLTKTDTDGRSRYERGVVAVWAAMIFMALIASAAFAIDLGRWYLASSRIQNAADSSALAGVVFMPGELGTARSVARATSIQNGYGGTGVVIDPGASPNQLRVTIEEPINNIFGSILGVDTTTITRTAVAEFDSPVGMGSRDNYLGVDPEVDLGGRRDDFTLGIAGPDTRKLDGDRYHSLLCNSSPFACSGSNNEYDDNGYMFGARVRSVTGDLRIQVFDPAYVSVGGQSCSRAPTSSQRDDLEDLTDDGGPYTQGGFSIPADFHDDAPTRYRPGRSSASNGYYCFGDFQNLSGYGNAPVDMTFIIRRPDNTPWNDLDNPVITDSDFAGCGPKTFQGYNLSSGEAYDLLDPTDGGGDTEWSVDYSDNVPTFAEVWRRWYTLCEIPAASVVQGDYLVQVRTNGAPGNPVVADPSIATHGESFFSMRAGPALGAGVDRGPVTLFARGRLPIFANLQSAATEFDLARVLPSTQDRVLTVELFDIGDASVDGTLTFIPPADSNMAAFTGCSFQRSDGGVMNVTGTCSVTDVNGVYGFNGTVIQVDIPIPGSYDCTYTASWGCWIRVNASFPGQVNDFTTWSVNLDGSPVRLIE